MAVEQGRPMPPMQDLLRDYLPIVIFMAIAAGLAVALMASAFIIAVRNPDP
jgi:NADH-quinone oxidoreductase subunit A